MRSAITNDIEWNQGKGPDTVMAAHGMMYQPFAAMYSEGLQSRSKQYINKCQLTNRHACASSFLITDYLYIFGAQEP